MKEKIENISEESMKSVQWVGYQQSMMGRICVVEEQGSDCKSGDEKDESEIIQIKKILYCL